MFDQQQTGRQDNLFASTGPGKASPTPGNTFPGVGNSNPGLGNPVPGLPQGQGNFFHPTFPSLEGLGPAPPGMPPQELWPAFQLPPVSIPTPLGPFHIILSLSPFNSADRIHDLP